MVGRQVFQFSFSVIFFSGLLAVLNLIVYANFRNRETLSDEKGSEGEGACRLTSGEKVHYIYMSCQWKGMLCHSKWDFRTS